MKLYLIICLTASLLLSCQDASKQEHTHQFEPIGHKQVVDGDTLYHTVGDWAFLRQDSALVTEDMLHGTPYVVDFFFTSCPTICPRVTSNMLRIHARFMDTAQVLEQEQNHDLKLVSFTVDPKRDSVGHLRTYAHNLGITATDRWWFLTGDKFELYDIAADYMSIAVEDPEQEGGFDHSGRILLVDEHGHILTYADGTDDEDVNHFMDDVAYYLEHRDAAHK